MLPRLLAVLAIGLSPAVSTSTSDGSIEAVIDAEMPAFGVPGLAYAVVMRPATPASPWSSG